MDTKRHFGNRSRACLPGWFAVVLVVLSTLTADATGWIDFVRTRHAPGLESQRVRFAVSFLNSEIGGAVLTEAELVDPGGGRYPMVRSSSSRSQTFGIELELASEPWPSGTWMIELREGGELWDNRTHESTPGPASGASGLSPGRSALTGPAGPGQAGDDYGSGGKVSPAETIT